MDELHRETRRLILESRNLLEALESACTNTQLDPAASSPVRETFRENVTKLTTNATSLRRQVTTEPPSRRQVWKARLRDLDDQISELRSSEAQCLNKFRKNAAERQMRDELLQRRDGKATVIHGMEAGYRAGEEAKRLDDSTGLTSNILGTGRDTLQALFQQKDRLRGAKKKVLDVLHQIGVDRQIIARIERREYSDMLLVYGLMVVMLILLALAVAWKYHRRRIAA